MPVLPPRLYVREYGVFYLRIITPKALQATTGKRETWHSLRTKDPTEARILALSYALELERAKAGMGNKKSNIAGVAAEVSRPLSITTPDGFKVDYDHTDPTETEAAQAFIAKHTPPAITEAQRLAWQAQELAHLRDTEAAFRRMEAEAQHLRSHAAQNKPKSPLFSDYAQAFLTLTEKTAIKDRTKKVYAAKIKVWQDFIGKSATLDEITPQTILNFQTWLAKDDPLTERKGISARTIDTYTEVISQVYKTTIKKLADNPVEKRLVGKKQRMKSNRKPFTPDELTRIFDPERLNLCANPADVFVPILGLLTGSRPSNICQLRLGDIRREDGINVISYHDYLSDNSAKTDATNRIAPLHPILEKIGFLRYLDDIKNLPDTNATTLIFPWLNLYEQGYADVPTQNFTKVLKELGIWVFNVKVFYSLRHTTNQRMKDRGVPEDFRSQYIGHENDSVNHRTYGGTTPTKFLLEAVIPHLGFEEIDWNAIQYQSNPSHLLRMYEIAQKRDRIKVQKAPINKK